MTFWHTNKYLRGCYDKVNRKYFGDNLPKETLITWRKPFVVGHGAEIVFFDGPKILILVNPILRKIGAENYAIQSLMHEMCHLSLWCQKKSHKTHGPLFHAEMKRLVDAGAFRTIW